MRAVDVQYRKNLAEFNAWEDEKRKDQELAVKRLRQRERRGFKVSPWVGRLGGILFASAVTWVLLTLMFSQDSLTSWPR